MSLSGSTPKFLAVGLANKRKFWQDLYEYIANGRNNTIDKLKRIIDGINDECHAIRPIPKHGKKQDLIDRICNEMNDWHAKHSTENYAHAKEVIVQVRDTGRSVCSAAERLLACG